MRRTVTSRIATPTRGVTAGITGTVGTIATTGTTAAVGVMAIATIEAIETATGVSATNVDNGIDVSGDRRVAVTDQGAAESCALMPSMRLRLTPRSLSPSRDAERTWITPAAGSSQNSVSSTKRNHWLVNSA